MAEGLTVLDLGVGELVLQQGHLALQLLGQLGGHLDSLEQRHLVVSCISHGRVS